MPVDDYIQIMIDSLKRKSEILDELIVKNEEMHGCVADKSYEDVNWDSFNLIVAQKQMYIDRIVKMDEGFQSLYDRVKEQLNEDRSKYVDEIKEIQKLIEKVTGQGIKISTGEERNKKIIEKLFGNRKKEIKRTRNSLKVANSYAQTMSGDFGMDFSAQDIKK
jgi:dGTP triphosphohydrolase